MGTFRFGFGVILWGSQFLGKSFVFGRNFGWSHLFILLGFGWSHHSIRVNEAVILLCRAQLSVKLSTSNSIHTIEQTEAADNKDLEEGVASRNTIEHSLSCKLGSATILVEIPA